ncbi:methyltransferase domain protein [Mycobacterium numidiamassiliense]|uniref:Methyltransferase domain protein n=1 Tax=Mycobacterium numidiamassiliense TaxID=1841861 RepID=A0A2U3P4V0_9MYCO|nr:methyltransferase domain protein [Mycobacterium numidiamassiliense]
MRPLVHRLGVIDPLLEDHLVHRAVWSVVASRLD